MNELGEIMRVLGRVEGTLDAFEKTLLNITKRQDSHSKRINRMENKLSWYSGGAAMVGVVVGGIITLGLGG